jgi:hypothetical protein
LHETKRNVSLPIEGLTFGTRLLFRIILNTESVE